jgi:uncharacterized protein YbjT (DUF2867 family)
MIAITGATGNVGRTLVQLLANSGEQVGAISRRPADLPAGVKHHLADLAEPESLRPALDGADTLFLLVAGESPRDILDVAKAGGVRRVVLLSSLGAGTRPQQYPHPREFEHAVQDSGLDWTVLRPGGFASNAFRWAESIRAQRTVSAPFGEVGLPIIDPADIAEVAAAVLRDAGHAGHTYELTGPAAVTPRQQATAIGVALGVPVRFVEQTRDEARAQLLQFMPEVVVDGTLSILGAPLPAEAAVSPEVERLLGRTARTFAGWAARNVDAFR